MKSIFLLLPVLLVLSTTRASLAQNAPWTAKLILQHPDGTQDTAYFGCADGGGIGYQQGLDEIDTTIGAHISLLGYDGDVQQQFNPSHSCGNLRTNIQDFYTGVHNFYFYTYSDSLPPWTTAPGQVKLLWDTMDFINGSPNFPIYDVLVYSNGGYLGAIDQTGSGIYHMGLNFPFNSGRYLRVYAVVM